MFPSAPRLLEREAALQALQDACALAGSAGRIALVSGEAGVGKSSLVTAFIQSFGEAAFVALGRCDALFTPRVLGPAYDIAAAHPPLRRTLESSAPRPAVFAAFLELLRGPSPRVVVFEDVHWADEATLDLIKFLGRRIGDTRTLLVLTYRDDEVGPDFALRQVLGELPRQRCSPIALLPLSLAGVAELVAPAKRQDIFDPTALHRATNGNPFYLTEIMACGGGVPGSVRDAVLARAARVGVRGRAVADLVSVSPAGLELAIVEGCVEQSTSGIAECEQRGILQLSDGMLRFRHEIARLAILGALDQMHVRQLNAQVLAALRTGGEEGDRLARLAHHAQSAGEGAAATRYAVAAARRASAMGAHRQAADHYAQALGFGGQMPDAERAALSDEFAWECHLTGRPEGVEARRLAISLWRGLGNREREAQSLANVAHLLVVLGRDAEGEAAMREALGIVAKLPAGPAQAFVYRLHAYVRMLERDVEVAIADGHKALALAERFGTADDRASVLNTIGSAMLVAGDEKGVEYLERSLALAQTEGLDYYVANAYGNLGSASGEVHRFEDALRWLDLGIAWTREHDLDNAYLYQTSWRSLAQLFLGRWNDAAESARVVLDNSNASVIARIMALIAMGRLRSRRGDPGAWESLDEALALAERTQTLQRIAPVRAARAEAAWLAGEDAACAREAMAADELARRKRHGWFVGELAYWQWKGGRAVEVPGYAAQPYALQVAGRWREAAEAWKLRGCPYEQARALAEGTTEAKLEALTIFDDLGARPAAERLRQALRAAGMRRIPRGPRASTRAQPAGLTAREVQILGLIAESLTNAEIGARLHISPKTVDHHVSAVLAKLGATSRRAAVKAAEDAGVLTK